MDRSLVNRAIKSLHDQTTEFQSSLAYRAFLDRSDDTHSTGQTPERVPSPPAESNIAYKEADIRPCT